MTRRLVAVVSAAALGLPLLAATTVLPAAADDPAPAPIAVEPLGPRSTLDHVSIRFKVKHERSGTEVIDLRDPSRIAVAEIVVQPGAQFPLHTHHGPVLVSVVSGELTYVDTDTCRERVHPAGTAFVDTGTHVHGAYGSGPGETRLVATFFSAPATGPLTLPEAVQTSPCT